MIITLLLLLGPVIMVVAVILGIINATRVLLNPDGFDDPDVAFRRHNQLLRIFAIGLLYSIVSVGGAIVRALL